MTPSRATVHSGIDARHPTGPRARREAPWGWTEGGGEPGEDRKRMGSRVDSMATRERIGGPSGVEKLAKQWPSWGQARPKSAKLAKEGPEMHEKP